MLSNPTSIIIIPFPASSISKQLGHGHASNQGRFPYRSKAHRSVLKGVSMSKAKIRRLLCSNDDGLLICQAQISFVIAVKHIWAHSPYPCDRVLSLISTILFLTSNHRAVS